MMKKMKAVQAVLICALLTVALVMAGCSGNDGSNGAPGTSTGTVSGTVTPATATVTITPSGSTTAAATATASAGSYSVKVPIGVYDVTFSATGYTSATVSSVSVVAGKTITLAAQTLTASATGAASSVTTTAPSTVSVTATAGGTGTVTVSSPTSPIKTAVFTVTAGPIDSTGAQTATVVQNPIVAATDPTTVSATVTFPKDVSNYINQYINVLKTERGIIDETTGKYEGALPDRDAVMGINPQDLEAMTTVTVQAVLTLDSGDTVTKTIDVPSSLAYTDQAGGTAVFDTTTDLRNVPVGVPVLLHSATETSYTWSVAVTPTSGTSKVTKLMNATAQDAYFTPDVEGKYAVTMPDGNVVNIYAGTWGDPLQGLGAIGGIDTTTGNPTKCASCHNSTNFSDWSSIFSDWANTGHAHKFERGIETTHYGTGCFSCHTVGYNTNAVNNGFDEANFGTVNNIADSFDNMMATFFPNNGNPTGDPNAWTTFQSEMPKTASLTNIQCENCHGPNTSPLHNNGTLMDTGRYTFSAQLCASCHGEPTHHPSYQLWKRGAYGMSHGNTQVAMDEGLRSGVFHNGCGGCHTAQGALAWFDQLQGIGQTASASRTLTATSLADPDVNGLNVTNVEPQTCIVCHDPHNVGNTVATAQVRFDGNTPPLPAGFTATGLGKGAMCVVCHNSRNGEDPNNAGSFGLHEDNDTIFGTLTSYAAPHEACQGDVLMGRNAYFFNDGEVGSRSPHSFIPDSCVQCHMNEVAAPADLAGSGATPGSPANHTFNATPADPSTSDFCADCHGAGFNRTGVQSATEGSLQQLLQLMVEKADVLAQGDAANAAITFPTFTSTDPVTYGDDYSSITVTNSNGDTMTLTINYSGPGLSITPSGGSAVTPALPFDDTFAKAAWNEALIAQDKSLGVHNPGFTSDVLQATITAVQGM